MSGTNPGPLPLPGAALPPVVDARDQAALLADLAARAPGFVPGWDPVTGGAGGALARIFCRYLATLANGLNRVPERHLLAFLDMLGTRLLPAESARAPIVFTLMPDSPSDPLLPTDSQIASPVAPRAPSPLDDDAQQVVSAVPAQPPEAMIFATTQAVSLTRARLATLYALVPGEDRVGDYSHGATQPFSLYGDLVPVEHAIYLGHDRLFALAGNAQIRLFFSFGANRGGAEPRPLEIVWEYLSTDGWLPLNIDDDKTSSFTIDGEIRLVKGCGPDAQKKVIAGSDSYWLRGRLVTPLPPDAMGGAGFAPTLDGVRMQVAFSKAKLPPELAMAESTPLDVTRNFFPFGRQPTRYTTFYLASKEVFQRRGARVGINITLSEKGTPGDGGVSLAFEYWDGDSWQSLDKFERSDGTLNLTQSGSLTFLCPPRWSPSNVAGQTQHWLRVRIDTGDYGHPLRVKPGSNPSTVTLEADSLNPPVIAGIDLDYTYQTDPTDLDHCLTFNDFTFSDDSQACLWPRRVFQPFRALSERAPAFYFGFDRALPVGLVSLFVGVPDEQQEVLPDDLAFVWEYQSAAGWTEMAVLDETLGFRRSGMIQLVGPSDAVASDGLGGVLYRIRARLKEGSEVRILPLAGVWLNAAWATNRLNVTLEALGNSDGNPDQSFFVQQRRVPILEGEILEVREWAGEGTGWELVARDGTPQDVRLERDPTSPVGAVRAVWIRWREQPHLYDSGPSERVYMIERATGRIRFGGRGSGAIPPAGNRIVISYSTGGGTQGNVAAGAISELRSGVPYLKQFGNPVPAEGGAATEAIAAVYRRGTERLRHRNRAVSPRDYEWLARDASAAVARACCLPVTGPEGRVQRGFVTLIIVPHDDARQPYPSAALRRRVSEYLAARMPASAVGQVLVRGPGYVAVGVSAEIVPRRPEEAAAVEARVLAALARFLHPLTGAVDSRGWDFGQAASLSQIARLIEETPGVDYAPRVGLRVGDALAADWVPVAAHELVASGSHELKLTLAAAQGGS